MISPKRFLSSAALLSASMTFVLCALYYQAAIDQLHDARLQTDTAISRYLPQSLFSALASRNSVSDPSTTPDVAAEIALYGVGVVGLAIHNRAQQTLLSLGQIPADISAVPNQPRLPTDTIDTLASPYIQQIGGGLWKLISFPAGPIYTVSSLPIPVSAGTVKTPLEQLFKEYRLLIYADVSHSLNSIAQTLWLMLGALITGFSLLNAYLYRTLLKGSKTVELHKARDTAASHKAGHDALTGLPNRVLLNDRLRLALDQGNRHGRTVVILFLDLDGFKAVNDTHGHRVGDLLLKQVAKRLVECIREGDTVSRLGGDEFVLVLPLFDSRYNEQVPEVAQRILDSLAQPFKLREQTLRLGCSIGISRYPDDGTIPDTLLNNADQAMYRAKQLGRNNYQFYRASPNDSPAVSLKAKHDPIKALEQQELHIYYQPQYSIIGRDGVEPEIRGGAGVAAILHWQHAVFGMTLAEQLLPDHTNKGSALPVGAWMIEQACLQRQAWHKAGVECGPLVVTITPNLFQFDLLAEQLRGVLQRTGLHPRQLELELSACLTITDPKSAEATLLSLKEIEIRLAADAPELSPRRLCEWPLDRLYIGPLCIESMLTNKPDGVIVRAAIALGRQLSLPVIATGVENREQLAFLSTKQCRHVQGRHLSPPLSAQELTTALAKHSKMAPDGKKALPL